MKYFKNNSFYKHKNHNILTVSLPIFILLNFISIGIYSIDFGHASASVIPAGSRASLPKNFKIGPVKNISTKKEVFNKILLH